MKPIQIAVTFDTANRRKDRTVRLSFTSNLEVSTEDYAEMDRRVLSEGWLLFGPNEMAESDVPQDQAPGDNKKPSVRMRGVLWHIWDKNTDRSEPFDMYYQRIMDRLIDKLKEQLD
jgi:hypothetical protein